MWTTPMNRPVGVSSGGRHTNTVRGQRRRQLLAAHDGERLGDGGLGSEDDRLGGHETAGGLLVVRQQPSQRGGLVGFHQLEQLLLPVRGQLGQQVGRVVGLHRLEHVGGAFGVETGEDLDLVVLGQLLEDVGQLVVVKSRGDLGAALRRQVVDHLREVGDAQVVVVLEQLRHALRSGVDLESGDVLDVDEDRLTPTAQVQATPAGDGVLAAEHLGDVPVPPPRLHGDVLDGAGERPVGRVHRDAALEQLGQDQRLVGALLEPAHVDQSGRDHLPCVQRGHAGHGDEHPPTPWHLGDEPDHPGPEGRRAERHDDVTHPPDGVSQRVEDAQSRKTRAEDTGSRSHVARLDHRTTFSASLRHVARTPNTPSCYLVASRLSVSRAAVWDVRRGATDAIGRSSPGRAAAARPRSRPHTSRVPRRGCRTASAR